MQIHFFCVQEFLKGQVVNKSQSAVINVYILTSFIQTYKYAKSLLCKEILIFSTHSN